jgi:hypothetical protein
MKIIQIHVWIQNKRETWAEPEVLRFSKQHPEGKPVRGKRIVLEPESQSITAIKMQIARELMKWKGQLLSYYVVIVVEKRDGAPGYRTIVPKIVLT